MVYLRLFYTFLKIGMFSFGGGYAMLPLIEKEVIHLNSWVQYEEFIDIIATSQMTPGPIAINSATFIGYKIGGIWGSVVSTLGVILVPTIIILILSRFVYQFKNSKVVTWIFDGLRPALIGLILASAFSVARTSIYSGSTLLIAFVALILIWKTKIHPIATIMTSGLLGLLLFIW